jgi:hypothetical protein
MRRIASVILATMLSAFLASLSATARPLSSDPVPPAVSPLTPALHIVAPRDLRLIGVHDAGDLYMAISAGSISDGFNFSSTDPETDRPTHQLTYPAASQRCYTWGGGIWVGGVVGADTLVSVALDGWLAVRQFSLEDPRGGTRRIGNFADDEFISVAVDTLSPPYYPPLGVGLTTRSYSWADTLYDNFILVTYTVRNLRDYHIADAWVGLYMDNDIYHLNNQSIGYSDDCSATLDTLLYDDDPSSRTLIAYSYDNNGDPVGDRWDSTSTPDVISVRLVHADFPVERCNFNWWFNNYTPSMDFGPRRLGTPDDPLRLFGDGNFGYPVTAGDKYYLLSHPEIDYDQIEVMVHDSTDGWVSAPPSQAPDFADGYDTRFMYSFGPFDLPPGDSVSFTLAIVAADRIHRDPTDFAAYFDPLSPQAFRDRLDFGPLMVQHRRADSVYKSGLILPTPGPPQGLVVTDNNESSVRLAWWPSQRPDLAGYYLYVQGTSGQWFRTSPYVLTDTTSLFYVPDPTMTYRLAVGAVDIHGRQSSVSVPVSILPGRPQPVENLDLHMDGMIPELTWIPHDDSTLQAYFIYRSIGKGSFHVYDSTTTWRYRDLRVESGIQYNYQVTVKNRLGLESLPAGPVAAIPLARDKGVLFYSLNRPGLPNSGPFQNQYLADLYRSAAGVAPIGWHNYAQGALGLKQMADYELIVIDWEKREDGLPMGITDSLRYYLAYGGKAIFILLSTEGITSSRKIYRYGAGSFFHDILKLDSAVTNGYNFQNGAFVGDLAGCQPLVKQYPALLADTIKFRPSMIPIAGFIPMAGYLFPTNEVEPLYRYVSSHPDSISHGQVNGIRYRGASYSFMLFTFPLSLMKTPAAFLALKQALVDMGVDMGCGEINDDDRVNMGDAIFLAAYLFRGGPPPSAVTHADVDGSGAVDLADAVYLINFFFRGGPGLACPEDQ